jgi:TPR repeat protein
MHRVSSYTVPPNAYAKQNHSHAIAAVPGSIAIATESGSVVKAGMYYQPLRNDDWEDYDWVSVACQAHPEARVICGNSGRAILWQDYLQIQNELTVWCDLQKDASERADAAYEIGTRFLAGNQVPQSDSLAAFFLLKAWKIGHKEAAYQMGNLFLDRNIFRRNVEVAKHWYGLVPDDSNNFTEAQYVVLNGKKSDDISWLDTIAHQCLGPTIPNVQNIESGNSGL